MLTEQESEMVLPRFTWISWEPIILARTAANGQSKLGYFSPVHRFSKSLGTGSEKNYFLEETDFNCIR